MKIVNLKTQIPIFYVGKDLSEGPLPAVFYFALSAEESLVIAPYNSPATNLQQANIRVFSVDLPFHGKDLPATEALGYWAQNIQEGTDFLGNFLNDLENSVTALIHSGLIDLKNVAAAGLSRGCFIATHLAARIPTITHLLAFAPLTHMENIKEFELLKNSIFIEKHKLCHIEQALIHKNIKTYIGGRDTRVNTDLCYKWIRSLIEKAYEHKIKSPHIELVLKPSIGHQGHGTSKESFEEGSLWLINKLSSNA